MINSLDINCDLPSQREKVRYILKSEKSQSFVKLGLLFVFSNTQ